MGAKIFDEFSQYNTRLWHADCFRTAAAREHVYDKVRFEEYADPNHSWGDIPIVIICGDELQLPPVPAEAGLFAPIEGKSHEQKVGVRIFSGFHNVYRLTTAMRFNQELHIGILEKMRTRGGCTLSRREWAAIENTNVENPETDLVGTENWYQASYLWSVLAVSFSFCLCCTRPHQTPTAACSRLQTRPRLPTDQEHRQDKSGTRDQGQPRDEEHRQDRSVTRKLDSRHRFSKIIVCVALTVRTALRCGCDGDPNQKPTVSKIAQEDIVRGAGTR